MHHPKPAARTADVPDTSSTATAMLDVAERLFAEHGIAAVSLRQIVLASGQGNLSAAHYHFGSRDGLIRALVERRMRVLDAIRHRRLDAIEADGRVDTLGAVVEAAVGTLAEVVEREPWGPDYVQVLAQMMFESGLTVLDMIDPALRGSLVRARGMVRRLLPGLPRPIFESRVERVHHETVQTFARWIRAHGPVDASNRRAWRASSRDLVAFLSAGLAAPLAGPRLHHAARR
ncbi:MAG: hypothetical protein RJA99_3787 [Pseudomonadota bacterium]|jgi:AcrR family transcriptional regulator